MFIIYTYFFSLFLGDQQQPPRPPRAAAAELTAEQLLQLSHEQLILGDPSQQRTAYACEGRRLQIGCPNETDVIRVIRANYGRSARICFNSINALKNTLCFFFRFSVAICNDEGRTDLSVNCLAPNSLQVMRNRYKFSIHLQNIFLLLFFLYFYFYLVYFFSLFRCDNKNFCSVRSGDRRLLRGLPDPCPGTHKYLEVTYGCFKRGNSAVIPYNLRVVVVLNDNYLLT